MLLVIADVLSATQLEQLNSVLAGGKFDDGKTTAGARARKVKDNLQFRKTRDNRETLNRSVREALEKSDVFQAAVLPQRIHRPLFSRYEVGMEYGYHVDAALMDRPDSLRTDVAVTVFLNDAQDYDGGELVIDSSLGSQMIKLPAGSAVVYPAATLHRVAPVTRGVRLVAVTWVQSHVRDPARREVLFDLHRISLGLDRAASDSLETDLAYKTYSNLLRMWADT